MRPQATLSIATPSTPVAHVQCRIEAVAPPDAAAGGAVGGSVAMLGDLAVVGAPAHDALGARAGAAPVLERAPDGTRTLRAELTTIDAEGGDRFGATTRAGSVEAGRTGRGRDDVELPLPVPRPRRSVRDRRHPHAHLRGALHP